MSSLHPFKTEGFSGIWAAAKRRPELYTGIWQQTNENRQQNEETRQQTDENRQDLETGQNLLILGTGDSGPNPSLQPPQANYGLLRYGRTLDEYYITYDPAFTQSSGPDPPFVIYDVQINANSLPYFTTGQGQYGVVQFPPATAEKPRRYFITCGANFAVYPGGNLDMGWRFRLGNGSSILGLSEIFSDVVVEDVLGSKRIEESRMQVFDSLSSGTQFGSFLSTSFYITNTRVANDPKGPLLLQWRGKDFSNNVSTGRNVRVTIKEVPYDPSLDAPSL